MNADRTPLKVWLVSVLVTVAGGGAALRCSGVTLPTDDSAANDKSKNDDPTDDAATDGGTDTDPTGSGPKAGECEWRVAESFPQQYFGDCRLPPTVEGATITFKLDGKPGDGVKILVMVGKETLPESSYSFDAATLTLTINTEGLAGDAVIRIHYQGAGEFKGDDPEQADQGTAAVGRIIDANGLDGCKWLIEVDGGTKLEPVNLPKEFQVANLDVSFGYVPAEGAASICMGGQLVTITKMRTPDGPPATPDPVKCQDANKAFQAIVTEVEALPKTCAADADCALYGVLPRSGCPVPHFTAKGNLTDAVKARFAAASSQVNAACEMPLYMCGAAFPSRAACSAAKVCEGSFDFSP